jgi:hypothetical protein
MIQLCISKHILVNRALTATETVTQPWTHPVDHTAQARLA